MDIGKRPIQTSDKDFWDRGNNYDSEISALNENIVNSMHAKNTKHVKVEKFKYQDGSECIAVANDGEFFSQKGMDGAIGTMGCESANTPGNQFGSGMKCSASYHMNRNEHSFMVVVSKNKNGEFAYGAIDALGGVGVVLGKEHMRPQMREYAEYIEQRYLSEYQEGTVTSVFDASHLDEFDIKEYKRILLTEFSDLLKDIELTIQDENETQVVEFQDIFYRDIKNDDRVARHFTMVFDYEDKNLSVRLDIVNLAQLHHLYPDKETQYDKDFWIEHDKADDRMWGLTAGWGSGYTPLYRPGSGLMGDKDNGHYDDLRAKLTLLDDDKDVKFARASLADYKNFLRDWGKLTQTKTQAGQRSDLSPRRFKNFKAKVINEVKKAYKDWFVEIPTDDAVTQKTMNQWNADKDIIKGFAVGNERYAVSFVLGNGTTPISSFVKSTQLIQFDINHKKWKEFVKGCGSKTPPTLKGIVTEFKYNLGLIGKCSNDTVTAISEYCENYNKGI